MIKEIISVSLLGASGVLLAEDAWVVLTPKVDPMSSNQSYYSRSPISSPMNKLSFPYSDAVSWIGVGCSTDKTFWVYIGHSEANFSGYKWVNSEKVHYSKVKFDDQVKDITFIEESNGRDFLHIDFKDQDNFINNLITSNRVITGVQWYRQGDVWFEYSLKGSGKAINELFSKCGVDFP